MNINDFLSENNMSKYRLSKESGVPQTTIIDICNGKAHIEKCSAETIYKISQVLGVTMEELVEDQIKFKNRMAHRVSFEAFKSNVCHRVKDMGDIDFIIDVLESNSIRDLYEKEWYPEALYLLAMTDYLSRENDIPICKDYDDLRSCKLKSPLYPVSFLLMATAMEDSSYMETAKNNAIPEFLRHNIIESEIRNVY